MDDGERRRLQRVACSSLDGEVQTTGRGRDPGGELIERGRYHGISADGYSFTLDRSYDGGKTWIRPFVSFRATRRAAAK